MNLFFFSLSLSLFLFLGCSVLIVLVVRSWMDSTTLRPYSPAVAGENVQLRRHHQRLWRNGHGAVKEYEIQDHNGEAQSD